MLKRFFKKTPVDYDAMKADFVDSVIVSDLDSSTIPAELLAEFEDQIKGHTSSNDEIINDLNSIIIRRD